MTTIRLRDVAAAAAALLVLVSEGICLANVPKALSPAVTVVRGAVNGVCIERDGQKLLVYGDPEGRWKDAEMVLFTHGRRDIVWAGRNPVEGGAEAVVPATEVEKFTDVATFWTVFWEKRFHDYAQQSTRIPAAPLPIGETVRGGDRIEWQGLTIRVLDTPGYTRGAVSYIVNVDGIRHGFVGDLIYDDGRLFDLYSLQDAVPEARIGGYHGYAGRIGDLIASLRKVAAEKPQVLVPARGPVIRDPAGAIARLIDRLQAVYENYLSVSAGRWYFRYRYDVLAKRVLGHDAEVDWMPYAATIEERPPDWIVPIHNSRLILATDGSGFLVDCGSRAILKEVGKLKEQGRLESLDGVFITHYHDDHTDKLNECLREYDCPAYATPILEDVLKRPGAYRLPAMTANPVEGLVVVPDGHSRQWNEFQLTFYDFPGQTLYHDALLVQRDTGETVFFVGDSFTPTGIDDYCLQNRNLLHDGQGYFYCLDLLRDKIPGDAMLINQHVREPFRFTGEQLDLIESRLRLRKRLLAELFPWDEPNYGIDEQWARFYPYGRQVEAGQSIELAVKVLNHSAQARRFDVVLNAPPGFETDPPSITLTVDPREESAASFRIEIPTGCDPSVYVVTADIRSDALDLRRWCEGLIKVVP